MKKLTKKVVAVVLVLAMAFCMLAACGTDGDGGDASKENGGSGNTQAENGGDAKGGKILLLSNVSSGKLYDFNITYMDMWTKELGYSYEIIYGDGANDPAGNLTAVKNAMTSDVVGLIAMQDGGISDIMAEYPELFVVGMANDMASVYGEGGASAACADNEKFLGTVAGGYADGNKIGEKMAEQVIEKGYQKVAICMSPAFAYPQYAIADKALRAYIEEYNETASEKIEVVDDEPTVLMFKPLDDTYFNEKQHQDLDAIVGFCAGQSFIYPVLANAIGNGQADADTKLLTFGLEGDQALVDDVGTGIVQGLYLPNYEEMFFALVMLDNAIQGKQFADFEKSEVLDGAYVNITSDEVMTTVEEDSPLLSSDMSKLALSMEDGKQYFTRYNEDATYAQLVDLMNSDTFTEKGYEK